MTTVAYKKIFDRLGIGNDTYVTFASGGAFTKFSHEFQTVCDTGEDVIYLHRGKNIAINEEVMTDESLKELGVSRGEMEKVKTAEVGNIFNFGTQKSKDMNFSFTDEAGNEQLVYLGSYGIGITRVMGVIVEKFADERGIVWPSNIAPYKVYLARLGESENVIDAADKLYEDLEKAGVGVLYDDRDVRAGEKFGDADLLGIPLRVVVSEKTLGKNSFESKKRTEKEPQFLDIDGIIESLASPEAAVTEPGTHPQQVAKGDN